DMTQQPDPRDPYAWNPSSYPNLPPTAPPPAVITDEERTWGAIAHAGSFVAAWIALGVLAPILVLLTKGNQSRFVRHHAYESLNFQLNALIWIAVSAILAFVLIGFF